MRWWVYVRRPCRVAPLIVGALTPSSCIARLGDLRPSDDAGRPERVEVPKPPGVSLTVRDAATPNEASFGVGPIRDRQTDGALTESFGTALLDAGPDDATARDAGNAAVDGVGCARGSALGAGDAGGCFPCAAGGYCKGGGAPFMDCGQEEWDDDSDARTPCVPKDVCLPGSYAANDGAVDVNRSCVACEPGYFTATSNAARCLPWSECLAPNDFELSPPSADRNRVCGTCDPLEATRVDNAVECTTLVYRVVQGSVAIEAERPHGVVDSETDGWAQLAVSGISGSACMEVGPDDKSDWTEAPFQTAPRLDYLVEFETAGTYYIHIRGDAGANSDGYSDSCYAALDGTVTNWYRFGVNGGTWGWATQSVVVPKAGVHLVSILAREDGFRVDKFVVSTSATAPSGNGPAAGVPTFAR